MDNSTLINEILTKIANHRGKIQQFLDDPLASDVVKTYYSGQDTGLLRAEDVVLSFADSANSIKPSDSIKRDFESITTELKTCIDPMVYIEIFNIVVGDKVYNHGSTRRGEMIEAAKTTRKIIDEMFGDKE
jgi:hypothetical protein